MKPRRFAQRVAWAGNARSFGLRWRVHAQLICGAAVFVTFLAVWPYVFYRQALIGCCLGAVATALALSIARFDDPQVRGDLAEQWSAAAFGNVRGWRVTNGLSFADGDLDHVVVTPSGVLAVETKYRFHQPDKRRLAVQRHQDLQAAVRAARKVSSVLRSKEVGHSATVTPVLMVWGKGAPNLLQGYTNVDGAYVLDGDHPGLWSHLFNAPLLSPDARAAIHDALARYQRKQTTWADQHQSTLLATCWTEFWTGVRESRDQRRANLAKRRALRRRHHPASKSASVTTGPTADVRADYGSPPHQ